LAQPIAAAGHVKDDENGEGGEQHERASVHNFSPDESKRYGCFSFNRQM
jgi:hypothetical protein